MIYDNDSMGHFLGSGHVAQLFVLNLCQFLVTERTFWGTFTPPVSKRLAISQRHAQDLVLRTRPRVDELFGLVIAQRLQNGYNGYKTPFCLSCGRFLHQDLQNFFGIAPCLGTQHTPSTALQLRS